MTANIFKALRERENKLKNLAEFDIIHLVN